jgi:cytoskeletal protein RodZ
MAKFFGKLNSPVALIVVVVLFVALNGFLFYGYQLDSLPSIVGIQSATETDPASDESSADTSSEEEAASETEEAPASEESPADTSSEQEAASEAEEAPAPEESAATEEEANSGEAAGAEEGTAPSEEAAEAEGALRTVVSVVDAPTSLSIQVDGESVLEGVSEPGFSRQFEADRETIISTDNAGAVLVEVNGYGLGALGASGEPATRTFTAGA